MKHNRHGKGPSVPFLLLVVLLILALVTVQLTLGRFIEGFSLQDSARAAKFDVVVTAPDEFWPEESGEVFEYYFLTEVDSWKLAFQVSNRGEADVRCEPHINQGIVYRFYIDGESCTEFVVVAGERVEVWAIIVGIGLDTSVTNAQLFFDITQVEGRGG